MLIMLLMNIFMKTIMTQTVLKYDSTYIKMWHKLYLKMQYFKNCIWKAGRQTDEERSFFCGSLSNCPHQLVLGYSKPVAQNSIWVSHVWQGSKYLDHHLLPLKVHIMRWLYRKWHDWDSTQEFWYWMKLSQVAS